MDKDIGAINRALITAAKRGHELEANVGRSEINLATLLKAQEEIKGSLRSKRALLGEVLAALQRMGRKPPPAILVRPEDALAAVRSAILLGAVVPEIRNETRVLLSELRALNKTTRKIEQGKKLLATQLNSLAEDEARLSLLIKEKNELTASSNSGLLFEQKKAAELAKKAKSLKQLIGNLEKEIKSAARVTKLAKDADAKRQSQEGKRLALAEKKLKAGNFKTGIMLDSTRIEPAIAFGKAKGSLFFPVVGEQLFGFGSKLGGESGSKSNNIALATRPNARVRAPADSWVVYAGSFRSYGQLLILNAGDGYHLVLAGLSEVNVEPGRFVLAGEPVGRMGATRVASVLLPELGSNRPVLYVEFRKDGVSVDPAPWWGPRSTTNLLVSGG